MNKILRRAEVGKVSRMISPRRIDPASTPPSQPAPKAPQINKINKTLKIDNVIDPRASTDEIRDVDQMLAQERAHAMELARKNGREEGFEQGLREARKKGEVEYRGQIQALAQLVSQAQERFFLSLSEQEDAMVEIAYTAVCKILGDAWTQPAAVLAAVRGAVQQMQRQKRMTLHLAPQDLALVREQLALLKEQTGASVELLEDATLVHGGTIIESDTGTLDARLDQQLQMLKQVLLGIRSAHALQEAG